MMLPRRLRESWHAGLGYLSILMRVLEEGSDSRGVMGVPLKRERPEPKTGQDPVCDKHWSDVKID